MEWGRTWGQGASFRLHLPPKQGYRGAGPVNLEPQEGRERYASTWNTPSLKFMHSCSCTFIRPVSKRSLWNIGFLFHFTPTFHLLTFHSYCSIFYYPNKPQSPFWNKKGLNHIYSDYTHRSLSQDDISCGSFFGPSVASVSSEPLCLPAWCLSCWQSVCSGERANGPATALGTHTPLGQGLQSRRGQPLVSGWLDRPVKTVLVSCPLRRAPGD